MHDRRNPSNMETLPFEIRLHIFKYARKQSFFCKIKRFDRIFEESMQRWVRNRDQSDGDDYHDAYISDERRTVFFKSVKYNLEDAYDFTYSYSSTCPKYQHSCSKSLLTFVHFGKSCMRKPTFS